MANDLEQKLLVQPNKEYNHVEVPPPRRINIKKKPKDLSETLTLTRQTESQRKMLQVTSQKRS
jgi:hypothetical protein